MTNIFKAPAIVTKVTTMADGGLRVQADTNELTPETAAAIMSLHKKFGTFAFAPEGQRVEEKDLELPPEQKEFPNQKSLSERLRNVLWVLHEKRGGKKEDFEAFRTKQMERFIDTVKMKIEELS